MPFAWTAIHLIDIINGVAHCDPGTAPSAEKDSTVSSGSQRKVRKLPFEVKPETVLKFWVQVRS